MSITAYRTCPFCEATCGLEIELDGNTVAKVRGDDHDVFSHGFICPKSTGLKSIHEDPDRVRSPLIKRRGEFVETGWDEAFAEIDSRLGPILESGGRDTAAVYLGNPSAHNLEAMVYGRAFVKALGTRNIFTASTVDQMPKHVSAGLMFGAPMNIPIPDVDRTDYLLMLGANPLASNGSLLTAPDMRGRLRAIRERGGRVVVVDPRRSRTAEAADEHIFIKPAGDALFLFGILNTLLAEELAAPGELATLCNGLESLDELAAPFSAESVAPHIGIDAATIKRTARELAAAERAVVYGRIGTCTQQFGTLASWLVDVLNVMTGNLDRPGGAMFTKAAAGASNTRGKPGVGRGLAAGRWASRVKALPEVIGELPVSTLADEIETPGEGQVRALFTIAGNPAISAPNSGRLGGALEQLELMVSVDIYVNETTQHADVILPAPSHLERPHYDLGLYQFAARNVANYSPALLELPPGALPEWKTLLRLTGICAGQGPDADVEALDDLVLSTLVQQGLTDEHSPLHGRNAEELISQLEPRRGPQRILDWMLRSGPYGDHFATDPDGLTLDKLERNPHGIDLGALEPRLPEVLRTTSGKIELAPEPIVSDVERLRLQLGASTNGEMVLIGRRQLRSNNSWMHNVEQLVRGQNRCTAHVHPDDAERLGLSDGDHARVRSRTGALVVPVEVTEAIMPGVVSIPHGWGHGDPGVQLHVAAQHAGVNSNLVADETLLDPLSGNAVLNGIPVELTPA